MRVKYIVILFFGLLPAWPQAAQSQPEASAREVEYIAHRGESADAPENTLAAFRLAWERGVQAIELDVHQTKDGEIVVIHDATTERTTGVIKVVKESAFEELRSLDAGSWKGAEWTGEPIPTLAEALATIPEDGRCFIEIKVGPEAVPAVAEIVRASGKRSDQLAIISFYLDTIEAAKLELPDIEAHYLSGFERNEDTGAWEPSIGELIDRAKSVGADGLDLSYRGPLDPETAEQIKDAGLDLFVWTVDDPEVARQMVAAGVDGITTNRADWLRSVLEGDSVPADTISPKE